MSNVAGGISHDQGWKPLLRLGEDLARLPTSAEQSRALAQFIERRMTCHAKIWLASEYYPLPGEEDGEYIPSTSAPGLVNTAYNSGRARFFPPQFSYSISGASQSRVCQAAFPLVSNDKLLGVLFCERNPDHPFTQEELSIIEEIAHFSSHAFEIKRQQVIKDWRMEQLTLVSSVSGQIANLVDLGVLCQRVTQLIQETLGVYYVAIFTLDPNQEILTFQAYSTQASNEKPPVTSLRLGYGLVGSAAQTGKECLAEDVRKNADYRPVDTLPETRSEIALPLKVENRILGVLDVQSDRVNDFHENDIMVLRSLADNIALAVEGARLYQDLQRRAEQVTTIHEVSRALISILDLDQLLDEVVKLIQNHFGYPYVHIFTVHKNRGAIIYRAGSGSRSQIMQINHLAYPLDDPAGIIPWVAREGKAVLANNVAIEPRYRASELPPDNTQAEFTVPLLLGTEVLGILDIQSDQKDVFNADDLPLFEALSASIAIAIRNATLYQSERWRRQVAESLRDIAYLVSSNTQIDSLLEAVLDKLEQHLECRATAIWLVVSGDETHSASAKMNLAFARGVDSDLLREAAEKDQSIQAWLSESLNVRVPLIRLPDHPCDPLGAALQYEKNYSALTIPLRSGDQSIGIALITHPDPARYGSDAQAIAATFAGYAAAAILNTHLYQEAQEQAVISTLLLQVAEASQVTSSLDELLTSMVSFTRFLVGVQKIAFFTYNEKYNTFFLKRFSGIEHVHEDLACPLEDYPALARLQSSLELQIIQNPTVDLPLPGLTNLQNGEDLLLIPLQVRGGLLGAYLVGMNRSNQSNLLDRDESHSLSILQGIAHQASIAIDNIRLEEARQEEAYVTVALLQVAQIVAAIKDLAEILDSVVHLLPILVGVDACLVYLWDAGQGKFNPAAVNTGSHNLDQAVMARKFSPGEFRLLDEIFTSSESHFCQLPDIINLDKDWQPSSCLPLKHISRQQFIRKGNWLMGFPLTVQGRPLGALLVMETNVSPIYRERRVEIITGIAQQTAIAVENDRLQREMVESERIEREIQLARQIQQNFLPDHVLEISGWEIDSRWRTAREVGGDFYDIFQVKPGYFGIVIADVADKGMPAALYMAVTRTLIRAYMRTISSPSVLLDQINDLLLSESTNGMFITALYGILEVDSGQFTYANAGHNLPLVYRRCGQIESLTRGGIALGVVDDTRLVDQRIILEEGDLIYFYTDGVTDTITPQEEYFGENRLKEIISVFGSQGAKPLLNAIDAALHEFSQGQIPSDDITMMAIKKI